MTGLWPKATESATAARLLLEHGHYNVAGGRAYYAMFTAARVLLNELAGVDLETIKRHATVLRLFSFHFVKAGQFDAALARDVRRASAMRGTAGYDQASLALKEAIELVSVVDRFLAAAATLRDNQARSP